MTEREFGENVSLVVCMAVAVGAGFTFDAVLDHFVDEQVDERNSEISRQVDASIDADFDALIAQRNAISELSNQQDLAYLEGDQTKMEDLERSVIDAATQMEKDYEKLVFRAYTNRSFAEADFFDLAERAKQEGFPQTIYSDVNNQSVSFNTSDAKYLDICRINPENTFIPLQASFKGASQVDSCVTGEKELRGGLSGIAGVIGFMAGVGLLITSGGEQKIENFGRDLYRRRKDKKNKLGKN